MQHENEAIEQSAFNELLDGVSQCDCHFHQRARSIQRFMSLLPEAEANDLHDLFYATQDEAAEAEMKIAYLESKLKGEAV